MVDTRKIIADAIVNNMRGGMDSMSSVLRSLDVGLCNAKHEQQRAVVGLAISCGALRGVALLPLLPVPFAAAGLVEGHLGRALNTLSGPRIGPAHNLQYMEGVKLMTVAQTLKRARLAKKLSMRDLAVCSGVTARSIQAYEDGTRDILKAEFRTVCALCDRLGIGLDDLAYLATHERGADHEAESTLFES